MGLQRAFGPARPRRVESAFVADVVAAGVVGPRSVVVAGVAEPGLAVVEVAEVVAGIQT